MAGWVVAGLVVALVLLVVPAARAQPAEPPVADAGGPYAVVVGEPARLDATGSAGRRGGELSFAWDLDGDGATDDATGPTPTWTWEEEGQVTVSVLVTETADGVSASATDSAELYADVRFDVPRQDDVDRAIAVSLRTLPGVPVADEPPATVLLGTTAVFADSLASGGAQGVLGAPLLLTGPDGLDPRVVDELARLAPAEVLLLGGTAALSAQVEADLAADGYATRRVAGRSRVETATALAEALTPAATTAVLVRAHPDPGASDPTQAFADALAAGGLAAARGAAVLLTDADHLSAAVVAHLERSAVADVVVVGGPSAIAPAVEDELAALGVAVTRAGGADRAGTAVAVAAGRGAPSAADVDAAILVDGRAPGTWADAFPAALLSARTAAPIVLADGDVLPSPTAGWLAEADGVTVTCLSLVTDAACTSARDQAA